MNHFFALIAVSFIAQWAQAQSDGYTVSVLNNRAIDYSRPTHLLVVGYAHDTYPYFQEAAASQGQVYFDSDPSVQVVMIANKESSLVDEGKRLSSWGFWVVKSTYASLNKKSFMNEAMRFQKIASLEIYAHGNLTYGIQLGLSMFISPGEPQVVRLKTRFMDEAYAIVHGCNQGFYLAPYLSEAWEIPVGGALTSTNYQRLHSDGQFYTFDDFLKPPGDWSLENRFSFQEVRDCSKSGCLRMKPDNFPYDGMHGKYEAGLPFTKFFCARTSVEKCEKVMALSTQGLLDVRRGKKPSSFEDYKYRVQSFLCPVHRSNGIHQKCRQQLTAAETSNKETYSPFLGPSLQCDFNKCEFQLDCSGGGECLIRSSTKVSNTLVREYKSYLRGYQLLTSTLPP